LHRRRMRFAAGPAERDPMANRSPTLMLTAPSTPLFTPSEIDALVLAFGLLTAGVLMRGA